LDSSKTLSVPRIIASILKSVGGVLEIVLKCKASSVKTKLENVRASILQRKQCERPADVVGMPFAQPIKAGLDLVDVARAISCKDILEWGCVYTLSANATSRRLYGIVFYVVHP
jgi:hypothetical protein